MGRMRLHTRRLKKFNQLGGAGGEGIRELNLASGATIDGGTWTNPTIVTAAITTGNITNAVVATKLVIPTTAYTGTNATIGSFYTTGSYLYLSDGSAWKSGAGGLV